MNPSTIYHRPRSEFAFALDDTHYVFRLRTGRGGVLGTVGSLRCHGSLPGVGGPRRSPGLAVSHRRRRAATPEKG